jgi:hypothetical protein
LRPLATLLKAPAMPNRVVGMQNLACASISLKTNEFQITKKARLCFLAENNNSTSMRIAAVVSNPNGS